MPEPRFFYAAKANDVRLLQSYLARGVDVDARAVVGGFGAVMPSYSHTKEILEGDTALHVSLRNRKKEAARFLLDCGARRDLKAIQLAQDRGISDVFYTPAKNTHVGYPVSLEGRSSVPEPLSSFYSTDSQAAQEEDAAAAAYPGPPAPTAPVNNPIPVPVVADAPHAGVDVGIVCNGFDHHPQGDELRRYCIACLVEGDREYEEHVTGSLKIAEFVKNKFEERYGVYWHCAVGNYKQEYFRDFCDLKKEHSFQVYVSSWDNTYVLWKSDFMDTSPRV